METSKSQHSGCYCDDEAVVTHSGSVRNFFECPWSDETLTCVNCEAKIHIKCLQSPTPSSLINDYLFLLTCARCASNNEEHFVRPEKLPMVYIVTLLMHHLQSAEEGGKRGYFHYRHDVAKLLHLHHALLMPKTKTQNKNLHISVASVVSTYGRHIESGFTALGEAGWWKLIENEPPFLSKVYKQACRNPVDLKPEEPALQRRATRKKKQLSDEYVADFFRPKRSKGKAKQAAPAQPPAQLLPPAQTVVACKENSDDESLTIVDIVDQPESMNDATPQSVDIKSEPTIKHEHLMGPYELTVSEIKEELSGQPPMDSDYDDPTLTPSITESGIDIDTFALCDELPDVKGETDTERNLNSTTTSDTELATVDKSLDNGYEAPQIVQLDSTATSERTTPTAGKSLGGDDDITQSNTSGKGQSSFTAAEHGDASGTESEVESGREGLSTRSSSPGVEETKPAVLRRRYTSDKEEMNRLVREYADYWKAGGAKDGAPPIPQLKTRSMKRETGLLLVVDKTTDVMSKLEQSLMNECVFLVISAPVLVGASTGIDALKNRLVVVNEELKKITVVGAIKHFEMGYLIDQFLRKREFDEGNAVKELSRSLNRSKSYIYHLAKFFRVVKDHQKILNCKVPFRYLLQNLRTIETAIKTDTYNSYWKSVHPSWHTA